jgi:hypothetical protein
MPSADELKNKKYCKWHNSNSYNTNKCKVFHRRSSRLLSKVEKEFVILAVHIVSGTSSRSRWPPCGAAPPATMLMWQISSSNPPLSLEYLCVSMLMRQISSSTLPWSLPEGSEVSFGHHVNILAVTKIFWYWKWNGNLLEHHLSQKW